MRLGFSSVSDTRFLEMDLHAFAREAWSIVVPNDPFVDGYHIGAISEHLEALAMRQIRNLLITVPPRFGKSTLVSVLFPAWAWVHNPEEQFFTASYALDLASRDAELSRALINSEWYRARWPKIQFDMTRKNTQVEQAILTGGKRRVTAVNAQSTGYGGSCLILDDPHNINDVESDAVRESAVNWHNIIWTTRVNNPHTVIRVVVCQRAHMKDVAGDILDKGGYVHLNLPMEFERPKR